MFGEIRSSSFPDYYPVVDDAAAIGYRPLLNLP
jgi:hypothetical protein